MISRVKETLAALGTDADCWAFVRENLFNKDPARDNAEIDVISVDIWAGGAHRRITLYQQVDAYVVGLIGKKTERSW